MFNKILSKITENKELKESGKQLSITPPFPKWATMYPGFQKGRYHIYTANSGIGKTKMTKFFAITSVYNFIKKHPNYKVKIWYFALEETIEQFWLSFVSVMLYEKFKIELSPAQLASLGEFTLSNDELDKVRECQKYVDELSGFVEVIDSIFNPTGIYKYIRSYFENPEIGEFEYTTINEGKDKITTGYNHKEDIHYFTIIDHVSLVSVETVNGVKMDLWETIGHLSKEYLLKGFCKRFGITSILVQQQVAAQEKQEFYKGETIEQKLEPSLEGLADNKTTQREAHMVMGLFAPARYGITQYRGYDITKLKDKYRCIKILKDREYGLGNTYVHCYFNGANDFFEELPSAEEFKKDPKLYNKYI